MVLGVATAGLGGIGGELVRMASGLGLQVLYTASVLGYSRDLEEEADRRAVERVVAAGYDPRAILDVFAVLDVDYEGLSGKQKAFWSDHPLIEQRTAYTKELLAKSYPDLAARTDLRREKAIYHDTVGDTLRHDIGINIQAGYTRSAVALARILVRDYGGSASDHVLLGDAWRALGPRTETPPPEDLTKKAKKQERRRIVEKTEEELEKVRLESAKGRTAFEASRAESEGAYRKALETDPACAEAHRGLGYLFEKTGQPGLARDEFTLYLEGRPGARDRAVIERHRLASERAAAAAPAPSAPSSPPAPVGPSGASGAAPSP